MDKYYVRFTTIGGDTDKCWVYAASEADAELQVRNEYWNVNEIVSVTKAR